MKKVYLVIVSILLTVIPTRISRMYTQPPCLQFLLQHYDMSSTIQSLGYDPHITVYRSNDLPVNNETVTVYVHGWVESQASIPFLQANTDLLPGTVIGFDFKDACTESSSMPKLSETNFCQSDDIASLLATLKILDECSIPTFHLFGVSRGAGTIVTAMSRIMSFQRYKLVFKKLNITHEQAFRILNKVKKGSIILNCPLIDINESIKHKLAPYHAAWLSPVVAYGLLPLATSYSPMKDTPLRAAKKIQSLEIPTLVHFQKNDLVVGNNKEVTFFTSLQGPDSYLILGNDCAGHMHLGETLAPAVHAFRQKYRGPYLSNDMVLEKGKHLLAQSPSKPSHVQTYIDDFYAEHSYEFIPKKDCAWEQKISRYDMCDIATNLGYNPNIRVYHGDSRVKGSGATVYVHGYGDNYQFTVPYFQRNSYFLPGTVVSFNFQDVTENAFKLKFGKSSVGQAGDIAAFASVLKVLDECHLDTIHLFGYSRGGATIVTTLNRLYNYDQYASFFAKLCISKSQAQRIIIKIQKGTIILNCPLVDSASVARHWFGHFDSFVLKHLIPLLTEHRPEEDQAINAALSLQKMKLKILVHFQKNDSTLGNNVATDSTFYNNLKGPHTYLVIADEGGHKHIGMSLSKATQAFRKKYNAPYYPFPSLVEEGDMLLANTPQDPTSIRNYVARMYT